jgi:hypothetical protein
MQQHRPFSSPTDTPAAAHMPVGPVLAHCRLSAHPTAGSTWQQQQQHARWLQPSPQLHRNRQRHLQQCSHSLTTVACDLNSNAHRIACTGGTACAGYRTIRPAVLLRAALAPLVLAEGAALQS